MSGENIYLCMEVHYITHASRMCMSCALYESHSQLACNQEKTKGSNPDT